MPKALDTGPTERYLALPTKEGITLLRVGGALLWVDGGVFLSVYKDIVSFVLYKDPHYTEHRNKSHYFHTRNILRNAGRALRRPSLHLVSVTVYLPNDLTE